MIAINIILTVWSYLSLLRRWRLKCTKICHFTLLPHVYSTPNNDHRMSTLHRTDRRTSYDVITRFCCCMARLRTISVWIQAWEKLLTGSYLQFSV